MDFILQNLPIIICAVIGILLLVVELFMPGFGLPGIAGLVMLLASVIFTWIEHGAYAGLGATIAVLALGGIAVTISLKSASSGKLSRSPLILKDSLTAEAGYQASEDLSKYLGRTGETETVLRPAGIAVIDGERVNVVSRGEFIGKGDMVVVEKVEGVRVMVRKVDA